MPFGVSDIAPPVNRGKMSHSHHQQYFSLVAWDKTQITVPTQKYW